MPFYVSKAHQVPFVSSTGEIEVFPRNEKQFEPGKGWAMSPATKDEDGVMRFNWIAIDRVLPTQEPDFDLFYELAAMSELWQHINLHAHELARDLHTALTARKPLILVVRGLMVGIVRTLGENHALHATPSQARPELNLSQILNEWLAECHFGFTYRDL